MRLQFFHRLYRLSVVGHVGSADTPFFRSVAVNGAAAAAEAAECRKVNRQNENRLIEQNIMRTHVLIGALAAFLMVSCEGKSGTEQPSLEVSPEAMTFEAGSGTQQAAVTAQGVEWTHEVAEEAAEWLSAERSDDKTLTVTAAV